MGLQSISIVFLDSGTYYGYVPNGGEAPDARSREKAFDALFEQVVRDVEDGLRGMRFVEVVVENARSGEKWSRL